MSLLLVKDRLDPAHERELREKHQQLRANYLWIFSNEKMLSSQHNNQYIAVKDEQVQFFADTMTELLNKIAKSGYSIDSFAVEYITKQPACLLL
jgi:hypothetical protein